MNNYRNQRKDIRRTLKTMKIQQPKITKDLYIEKSIGRSSSKQIKYRSISFDVNKKGEQFKKKSKVHRYEHVDSIENIYSKPRQTYFSKIMSVQMKDHKFLKVSKPKSSEKDHHNSNTQVIRNRFSSYLSKVPRKNSQNITRLKTCQIYRPQVNRSLTQVVNQVNEKFMFDDKNISNDRILEEAEELFSMGKFIECINLAEKVLKQNKTHRKAMFLMGVGKFGLKKYRKALNYFQALIKLEPFHNKSVYLFASICHLHLQELDEAIYKIEGCIINYPQYFDAYLQKCRILIKKQDHQNTIFTLRKALKLEPLNLQGNLLLAQTYEKIGEWKSAQNVYTNLTKKQIDKEKLIKILPKKALCEKNLYKYKEQIDSQKLYLKINRHLTHQKQAQINYSIALSYYHLNDFSNSLMHAEQVFIEKSINFSSQALILITIIHILTRDYYQAYHTLLRKDHLGINLKQIEIYQIFCEGVINLMKRKFDIGLNKLLQIQQLLKNNQVVNFKKIIKQIYPMYLSYAYFCVGRTQQSKKQIQICLNMNSERLTIYRQNLQFNLRLCQGLIQYQKSKYLQAAQYFKESIKIYQIKPEGYLYLAGTLLKIYLLDPSEENYDILLQIKHILHQCITNLKQLNNNYAASAFYFKSCFSAYMEQWNEAMNQIDEAIQRGQDNDPQAFYVRALVLACCQSYKQAISDLSISISINQRQPKFYLLRSRCFQIEGDGNHAFLDLQSYIGLSPNDTQIHKYAGHLLFQNGAFQDAIQAYDNGQITKTPDNYNVFLTRSKTYFLLGDYYKCIQDMKIVLQLTPNDPLLINDLKVIQLLWHFFDTIPNQQTNEYIQISPEKRSYLKQQLDDILIINNQISTFGKIFRNIQLYLVRGMIAFYMNNFRESLRIFGQAIKTKKGSPIQQQQDYDEDIKDQQYFINQMHYNRAICHLMLGQQDAAVKCLNLISLDEQSKNYLKLKQFQKIILQANPDTHQKPIKIQIFSQKNKMSRNLNNNIISLLAGTKISIRLCIPYPKVQPPQISPKFQLQLLQQIDILKIQRKPQAPWILRQGNSIKFTQKIQNYSQLDLNNSELSKTHNQNKNHNMMVDNNSSYYNNQSRYQQQNSQIDQSLGDLKIKLRLDDNIQKKLNKIIDTKNTQKKG